MQVDSFRIHQTVSDLFVTQSRLFFILHFELRKIAAGNFLQFRPNPFMTAHMSFRRKLLGFNANHFDQTKFPLTPCKKVFFDL